VGLTLLSIQVLLLQITMGMHIAHNSRINHNRMARRHTTMDLVIKILIIAP